MVFDTLCNGKMVQEESQRSKETNTQVAMIIDVSTILNQETTKTFTPT
jgi:hypothetical protein